MRRAVVGLVLLGVACRDPAPIPASVFLLMECIECQGAELDSVVAGGQAMVPVLRRLLTSGPPTDRVERMERVLHLQLSDSARAPKPPIPEDRQSAIIARQVTDYRSQYRSRAALALGMIGGPQAREILCRFAGGELTEPVRAAVDSALVLSGGPC